MKLENDVIEMLARATLEMIERQNTKDEKNVGKDIKGTCQKLGNTT